MDYLYKILLYMIINWISNHTWIPVKNTFFQHLENQGILTTEYAQKCSLKEILHSIKENHSLELLHKNLPETYHVQMFDEPYRHLPYMEIIYYASNWIHKQSNNTNTLTHEQKIYQQYMIETVKERIKLYDLMDDVKRPYVTLYLKRAKLKMAKDILGVEKYEDIPKILPPIIPPEFLPNPYK